jgi:hypothetical protein
MKDAKRLGTARAAASVLGVSVQTLHRCRSAGTLVIDHAAGGVLRELTAAERRDRAWQKRKHLVATSLFGQQLPGRPWEFDLERLRRQTNEGPPAAAWGP